MTNGNNVVWIGSKTYTRCGTLEINTDDPSSPPLTAARYMCVEDQSDLIIYYPMEDGIPPALKIDIGMVPGQPPIAMCDQIDQPLTEHDPNAHGNDPVSTMIRDTNDPPQNPERIIEYKCLHERRPGATYGIHRLNDEDHFAACREQIGTCPGAPEPSPFMSHLKCEWPS